MAGLKIIKKGDRLIKEYVDNKTGKIAKYEPGLRLEVSDFKGTWYPAKVLEVDHEENEVLVHYDKWSSRFDEWIATDSNRLRPSSQTNVVQIQYKVGERVEALWSTDGRRYPGIIKAIHPNDYYEVLFDDGIKCKKKGSQIYKIQRITRGKAAQEQDQKPKKSPLPKLPSSLPSNSPTTASDALSNVLRQNGKTKAVVENGFGAQDIRNGEHTVVADSRTCEISAVSDDKRAVTPSGSLNSSPSTPKTLPSPMDAPTGELGKRKRACHDYSLFLKIPKRTSKSSNDKVATGDRRRSATIAKDNDLVVREEVVAKDSREEAVVELEEEKTEVPPVKRSRKTSMKGIESLANSPLVPQKARPGRKSLAFRNAQLAASTPEAAEIKVNGTGDASAESRFIDEQGNVVTIEQNSDGGWICPLEGCGKTFRKDSLLHMHLQHYHPGCNIKYLGKKLNVFEMAIEKAQVRTDSTFDHRDKDQDSPAIETTPVPQRRRKSMPVTAPQSPAVATSPNGILQDSNLTVHKLESSAAKSEVLDENKDEKVFRKHLADESGDMTLESGKKSSVSKLNLHASVVVSKMSVNDKHFPSVATHRVSKRGRPLLSRSWNKEREVIDLDQISSDEDCSTPLRSPTKRLKFSRPRRLPAVGYLSKGKSQGQYSSPPIEEDLLQSGQTGIQEAAESGFANRRLKAQGQQIPRRYLPTQRRRSRYSEMSSIEHIKARKLEVITDELLKMGVKKKIHMKPRFEDVKVDVINCMCSAQEEFGLMMQCELCQAWQHGNCYGVYEVTQLPPYYVCAFCRAPSNVRQSRKYEWYQETNTTGRLPKFSFCGSPNLEDEDKMQGCNELLNSLTNLQSLLRCTQVKISLLDAPVAAEEENQKLGDPFEEACRNDFQANFRPVLRHLLRHHRHDPSYVLKLRSQLEAILKQKSERKLDPKVKSRLHSRAASLLKQKLKKRTVPPQLNQQSGLDTSFSPLFPLDMFKTMEEPETSGSHDRDKISRLKEQLEAKLSANAAALIESLDDKKKFLLLTIDTSDQIQQVEPQVVVLASDEDKILGVGKPTGEVDGFKIVSLGPGSEPANFIKCTDALCRNSVVPAGHISGFGLCKSCRDAIGVDWSKKDFIVRESITLSCLPSQRPEDESSDIKTEPEILTEVMDTSLPSTNPNFFSLQELCRRKLKEMKAEHLEVVTSDKSNIEVPQNNSDLCNEHCENPEIANLRARILREQALLDMYLDTIEEKLKDLENGHTIDPVCLKAKLKDLEDLKIKVEEINENMELMRSRSLNAKPSSVQVNERTATCS